LAAIGTIADVASLIGENRALVKRALDYMRGPIYFREGIKKLFNDDMSTITAENISFLVAPRINAAGRLLVNGANIPVELFLETDENRANELARQLSKINTERKLIQSQCYNALKPTIEKQIALGNKILVLYAEDAPSGVVGLLAGNATEEYHRPTIVFSEKNKADGTKTWAGSARSIPEFHILNALEECSEYLETFGGHALAAGMSIAPNEEALIAFRNAINNNCLLTDEDLQPSMYWDIEISEEDVSDSLIKDLKQLEPFGEGCRRPTFKIKLNVLPNGSKLYDTIGETAEHLKLYCNGFTTIGFWMVNRYIEDNQPRTIEALGYVDKKNFKGNEYFQFVMDDYSPYIKDDSELVTDIKDILFNL
jgi:single-stranded-DNA-specific exonuclease